MWLQEEHFINLSTLSARTGMQHLQKAIRTHRSHPVKVDKESRLYELLQEDEFKRD